MPTHSSSQNSPVAAITGASSGIGEAFARRLAQDGYHLIITGRRKKKLQDLADALKKKHGTESEMLIAEFADAKQLLAVEKRLRSERSLAMLVNNAGFNENGNFADLEIDVIQSMIDCHVRASVRLTHAALSTMLQRKSGAIINVSSVAAFTPGSGSATYCAAKAYLNSFTEGLHLELAGTGVRAQTLCPGWTRTDFHTRRGMAQNAIPDKYWMTPAYVVNESLRALKKGSVVCVPRLRYKAITYITRAAPRFIYYSGMPLFRRLRKKWQEKAKK